MNRPLLLAILGLSIAGNAALGYLAMRHSSATSTHGSAAATSDAAAPAATARAGANAKSESSPAARAEQIAAAQASGDLTSVLRALRDSGLPDSIVNEVGYALVGQELARRRREIFDWASVPYWQNPQPTPEQQRAMRALDKERRALLANLGLPPSPLERAAQKRQFGDLPDDKVAAIQKIQADYQEMQQDIWSQAREGAQLKPEERMAQQKLLREEQQRDIEALLTPQERAEYELRTSDTSNRLRGQLRNLAVTEQEFRDLYAAQKAYDSANPSENPGPRSPEQLAATLAGWEQMQTQARRVLGDERYRQLLTAQFNNGQNATQFFQERPGITVDQIQTIARLARTIPIEMQRELNAPGLSGEERRARAAALTEKFRTQITAMVGAENAQALVAKNILPLPQVRTGNSNGAVRIGGGNP